ncbi:hypothetical protein GC175_10920 [bacterium]|nr:hypothetical protein [bacterium]
MSTTTFATKPLVKPAERAASEWRFVGITIVFVLVLTTLPYLYAHWSTPEDKVFMGMMLNTPDHLQYFSWMRELTEGHLSANKLTPEPNAPVFFNLLWWGMGQTGALLGLDYAGVYQVLRVVATVLFLLLSYYLCRRFLTDTLMRRAAFLLIAFAGGFGWVLIVFKYTIAQGELWMPLLVYIAEPNSFLSMLGAPHFLAAALYVFVFDLALRGQEKQQLRYAVYAGLVALFLGWQHAYDLILVYGILGFYTGMLLLRDRRLPWFMIQSLFIIGIISWWPALYSVLLTSLDPLWKEVLAQFGNAGVFTPNLIQLPILLGLTFLLALLTVLRENPLNLTQWDNNALFLRAWFWSNFLLIYIPTDYQIHMLNGWQIPIAILAVVGLFRYVLPAAQQLRPRMDTQTLRQGLVVLLIAAVIPTNVYLLAWRFVDLGRHDYPYYLHKDEVAAMAWLDANVAPDDVVLSSEMIGQYVPAHTGAHAFLAHWAQTVDYFNKVDAVEAFFNAETDNADRVDVLNSFSVDYVIVGPVERALGIDPLTEAPFAENVFSTPVVNVYAIQADQ